nr:uncharacterized protein LOC109191529 [Ipomoea batatas]
MSWESKILVGEAKKIAATPSSPTFPSILYKVIDEVTSNAIQLDAVGDFNINDQFQDCRKLMVLCGITKASHTLREGKGRMNRLANLAKKRQSVKDIGLGMLLDLNITNLPRKMGLWLVENFDPRSCTLQLQNGQSVHITTTDVAAILGLLMGHIEITKRTARAIPEILKE